MRKNFILLTVIILATAVPEAFNQDWPVLKHYDQEHTYRIALPIGGIGTGTVSLGGRGNLLDWEIMDRPSKGFNPGPGRGHSPFFTLYTELGGQKDLRLLEGPVPFYLYEGSSGAVATNHGLPRFEHVSFDAAYPFGQVNLSTPRLPLQVKIKAFNPLIPGDVNSSSIPMAVLDFEITNTSDQELVFGVCGSMQNFIGDNGSDDQAQQNLNGYRTGDGFNGIFFSSQGVDRTLEQWGRIDILVNNAGVMPLSPIAAGRIITDRDDDPLTHLAASVSQEHGSRLLFEVGQSQGKRQIIHITFKSLG